MASSMLTADVSALASTEADVNEALNCALHSCANDPDFAIICDFLQKFSKELGLDLPNFKLLLQWLTKTDEVSSQLREMQIKLLRKTRKTVHEKSWESALSKFCFTYSAQDGWEIERFGYKNSSVKVKLRILKELLESQFERNTKFRAKILTLSADSLRSKPIGRDRQGHAYWQTQDNDCNIRIYQEHLDEEIWQVVATNRDEFVNLINRLRGSEVVVPCKDISIIDEDTTSSISRIDSDSAHKSAPPEEKDDSQEDEQKVPKLSIKLVQGKSFNESNNHKDVGKGEEELAAEEDAKLLRKSIDSEAVESGEEEFEEIEEDYDDESGSEIESDDEIKLYKMKNVKAHEPEKDTKTKEDNKKVKPLLISQNKVLSSKTAVASCYSAKKRGLDQVDINSPPREVIQSANALKKLRPSLLDSKRAKTSYKYDDNKEQSEEDYEESEDEDADVEEELEEEDIDSVAAEEDENEEKLFVDYDDYDEDEPEVGVEISDPVVHVKGEGSGKSCDVGNYLWFIDSDLDYEDLNILSEVIVEDVFYVQGGGSGLDCLVGNNKNDDEDDGDNTVKRSAEVIKTNVDTKSKTDLISLTQKETERLSKQSATNEDTKIAMGDLTEKKENFDKHSGKLAENLSLNVKEENPEKEISQINGENKTKNEIYTDSKTTIELVSSESNNTQHEKLTEVSSKSDNQITCKNLTSYNTDTTTIDGLSQKTHATKMSALESLKKELRESKQKLLEKKLPTTSENSNVGTSIYNRKRRLTDQLQVTVAKPANSESEVDLNSENAEDLHNEPDPEIEDDGDLDVGGKRLKIRPKQSNSELRKKIEAQKVAANDETTSSSGGEEELRRRKKIILSKQIATGPLIKTEEIFTNFENKKEGVTEDEAILTQLEDKPKIMPFTPKPLLAVKKATQFTPTKVKPTLAEIIEKKLKKTSEKLQNDKTDVDGNVVQTLFSSINKSPIAKPLKKNLLTQIMQEESDAHAIPRKCTNSQELDATLNDVKPVKTTPKNLGEITVSKTYVEKPRPKPERQRKRRSSEETVQIDNPEEPEAKKEVMVIKNEVSLKFKKPSQSIMEEEKEDAKNIEIKMECLIPVSGRRSGRRSGVAPIYVDSLQSQRNRCLAKNSTKTEDSTENNKVETIETKSPRKDNKNTNKKQDNEKSEGDKLPDGKSSLLPKENDSAEVMSKKTTNAMETSQKFDISKSKTIPSIKTSPKGTRKKREVDAINIIDVDNETPVRQSRRIAQQKIREEAERRKLEEIALRSMKQELKKKKKAEKQSDPTIVPPTEPSSDSEESDVETKKKVQKKKWPGKNGNWSSGSEEQEEPDDDDEEPPHYETDPGSPLFKSDHEFSPESDIEDESQVVPMKRARTVRKEDADDDATAADEEEEACQKCNKSDHPEWILLCDNCDKGYHCSCLSPVLFYIPEGDWYCPPCQQEQLIKALENQLKEFDDLVENKKKAEEHEKRIADEEKLRKEREEESKKHKFKKGKRTNANRNTNDNSSANEHSQEGGDEEQNTSSDESEHSETRKQTGKNNKNSNRSRNSKNSEKRNHRERRKIATRGRRNRKQRSDSDSDSEQLSKSSSESKSSSSSSSTYSESDNEPIYKLRKRRQINVSYRLNEYDDLINSALKKEMDEVAGAGNLGRGKDISTIIEADKEEKARQKQIEDGEIEESIDKEIPKETKQDGLKTELKETKTTEEKKECIGEDKENGSDVENIIRKLDIKPSQKKKSRKLTTLDISSEDDHGSDEDFKGSSLDDDEDDTSISASNSDSSLEIYKRHSKSKKKRRKAARRAFRERRKDRRFLVDESDDEEVQRPKSKKKRKDDSDYTESEADDDDISELSENIDSADLCDDTTTDESDGGWRPNKRKKTKKSNTSFMEKSPMSKTSKTKKPKKVEYSDDDVSDSEEDEDDDDNEGVGSGKGMGKQPRSQPLKTTSSSTKIKGKGKEKPPVKTKKKKHLSEDEVSKSEDSEDSTRRTRGRRYAYIEDFDDDSSDGGIKPGVQRPDTPPEEREKFIKRQEEIKRMLAEKNAEGAKLVATPRLTPIKTDGEKDKRSPVKAGDSLSTVPLSVIRQAKVLDIDYLQRRGENLDDLTNDVGEVDDEFDDADLPDDLPEDMDEDAIARMVEEEEEFGGAAARELPAPDEVLRTINTSKSTKTKEAEKPLLPTTMPSTFLPNNPQVQPVTLPTSTLTSGLQEPVRKRLPMPTMHPPLLRHQFLMHDSISNPHNLLQRHGGPPPTSHLLQNALSAPLSQPLDRNYPPISLSASHHSLINRMAHSIPLQPTVPHALSTTRPSQLPLPSSIVTKSYPVINQPAQEKLTIPQTVPENKPRGRRKKITPLRDTLQKQQTAAAVTAATATSSALASSIVKNNEQSVCTSLLSSVIRSSSTAKLPMQASVITSMPPTTHSATSRPGVTIPSISGAYVRSDGPRFYDAPGNRIHQSGIQRHRGPPQMPPSLLPPHPANRSTYGPPPPLKGSNSGPPVSSPSNSSGSVRNPVHHVPPPYLGIPPNARHASPHLNMYSRPPMYGNPNFGPRVNLRPPNMHAPEFSTGSRTYPPYGFYPPPPPLTTPVQRAGPVSRSSTQIPPVASTQKHPSPASVIVSASSTKSLNAPLAKPQATPPSTPELTEPISSTKPILATRELPIKVTPTKLSSPTPVAPQTGKAVTAAVNMAEPRKKLTTLQAYSTNSDKKSQVLPTSGSSGSQSSPNPPAEVNDDSSAPGPSDNTPTAVQPPRQEGHASEFSGLVSYFSSQHDDYNT